MRAPPLALAWSLLGALAAQAAAASPPRFERDVLPILERRCVSCHGWWFPKASLRLDSREGVLAGGRSGPAVVPGAPDQGWLMRLIDPARVAENRMPPEGERLSADEIAVIAAWIRDGAR